MFTGIVEAVGTVVNIESIGSNLEFTLKCPFAHELKIDQSVAHDGCCLTVIETATTYYKVTAIEETLKKTNLRSWKIGSIVNLERCVPVGGRLDGHIVQGHVDQVGEIIAIENQQGSHFVSLKYDQSAGFITVPQGSITVNGISLTVARSTADGFTVAIIPYTWEFTNMHSLRIGDRANLEFDIVGKYIAKLFAQNAIK